MNGILVGIRDGHTTNWYKAHAMNRRSNGSMVAFARNDSRTAVNIPARLFVGAREDDSNHTATCQRYPCITTAWAMGMKLAEVKA